MTEHVEKILSLIFFLKYTKTLEEKVTVCYSFYWRFLKIKYFLQSLEK